MKNYLKEHYEELLFFGMIAIVFLHAIFWLWYLDYYGIDSFYGQALAFSGFNGINIGLYLVYRDLKRYIKESLE